MPHSYTHYAGPLNPTQCVIQPFSGAFSGPYDEAPVLVAVTASGSGAITHFTFGGVEVFPPALWSGGLALMERSVWQAMPTGVRPWVEGVADLPVVAVDLTRQSTSHRPWDHPLAPTVNPFTYRHQSTQETSQTTQGDTNMPTTNNVSPGIVYTREIPHPDNDDEVIQEEVFNCFGCGDVVSIDCGDYSYCDDNNRYYCDVCFSETHQYCQWCENYVLDSNAVYSRSRDEYMHDYCRDEAEDEGCDSSLINAWNFRPPLVFHTIRNGESHTSTVPVDPYYMGFELEVEVGEVAGSDPRASNRHVTCSGMTAMAEMAQIGLGGRGFLKEDGSISYGFEIVTHPHTLEAYHAMSWEWLEQMRLAGVRAWQRKNCGLHVHISTSAFQSAAHFGRFWYLLRHEYDQWAKLAGRHSTYAKWDSYTDDNALAARAYQIKNPDIAKNAPPEPEYRHGQPPAEIERMQFERNLFFKYHPNKLAKKASMNSDRYVAINIQNSATVELRFWRPSMRHGTVLAALEASHAAVEFTRNQKGKGLSAASRDEALSFPEFRRWVELRPDIYPYLIGRLNERMPLACTEDDSPSDDAC
jgi:hypothetical protein